MDSAMMDKTTFLQTLQAAREHLDTVLSQVDQARMEQPGVSGEMSVKAIIAHITWYERETVGLINARALVGSDLWYRPLDERNAAILEASRARPLSEVQAEARQVFQQLVQAVQSLSDDELNDVSRFEGMPGEWVPWKAIASNTYEHYPQHIPDIEAWLEQ
jgi:uncharacterized damage-inducible protein DinB